MKIQSKNEGTFLVNKNSSRKHSWFSPTHIFIVLNNNYDDFQQTYKFNMGFFNYSNNKYAIKIAELLKMALKNHGSQYFQYFS